MMHAPSPWTWDGSFPIRIIDAQGYVVAGDIMPSGEGNARLIAAAPDLLAACRMATMLRQLGGMLPGSREIIDSVVEQADAAIAKATGAT